MFKCFKGQCRQIVNGLNGSGLNGFCPFNRTIVFAKVNGNMLSLCPNGHATDEHHVMPQLFEKLLWVMTLHHALDQPGEPGRAIQKELLT